MQHVGHHTLKLLILSQAGPVPYQELMYSNLILHRVKHKLMGKRDEVMEEENNMRISMAKTKVMVSNS